MTKILNLKICCLYSNMHLWYLCVWRTLLISIEDLTRLEFNLIYDSVYFPILFLVVIALKNPPRTYTGFRCKLITQAYFTVSSQKNPKPRTVNLLGKSCHLGIKTDINF